MDPRTAATVTAPDLKKAFREGSGGVTEGSGEPSRLRIWLVLFTDGPRGGIDETHEFDLAQMDLALALMRNHLHTGELRGAAIEVAATTPGMYTDATGGVSQIGA